LLKDAIAQILADARDTPRPTTVRNQNGAEIFAFRPVNAEVLKELNMSVLLDDLFSVSLVDQTRSASQTPAEVNLREMHSTLEGLRQKALELKNKSTKLRALARTLRVETESELIADRLHDFKETPVDDAIKEVAEGATGPSVASLVFSKAKAMDEQTIKIEAAAQALAKKIRKTEKDVVSKEPLLLRTRAKSEWFEKFRWFFTSGGKLAVGGRDAQSNSLLIKRHLSNTDVVYHADLFGSPFFVLKEGRSQSDDEILQVAKAMVMFSSAWKSGLTTADAYWVLPDQVNTTAPGSGKHYRSHG
jgi:predicted ribosome quality control (RQC) complex YloA/Tae2 family protein